MKTLRILVENGGSPAKRKIRTGIYREFEYGYSRKTFVLRILSFSPDINFSQILWQASNSELIYVIWK